MSIESLLDSRVERAVKYDADSDTGRKKACLVAETVVGTYSGGAQVIAKETRRSVSSIENWAHAGRLYKALRKDNDCKTVRYLFRALPASHWWLAYGIQQSGYSSLHYLRLAEWHSWSGRAMMGEFDKDLHAGTAPLIFSRAVLSFRGLADELAKSRQLTPAQARAVEMVREAFNNDI